MKRLSFTVPILCFLFGVPLAGMAGQAGDLQVTQPDPRFRVIKQTAADGSSLLIVQNNSKTLITGLLAVGAQDTPGKGRVTALRVFDSVINAPHDRPIEPYQSYTFVLFGPSPRSQAKTTASLKAAIFSDGSTWGETSYMQRLLRLRRLTYEYTKKAVQTVESATRNGISCDQLAQEADQTARSKMQEAADVDEKQIAENVLSNISVFIRANARNCGSTTRSDRVFDILLGRLLLKETSLLHSRPPILPPSGKPAAH